MISKTPFRLQKLEDKHNGYDWPTFAVRDAENHCLATVGDVDCATAGKNEGNAKLFIASPALLNACQIAEATIKRLDKNGSAIGTLDILREAIALTS